MSEPEIARRCASCGVTLRKNAMFCPQCGNPISRRETTDTAQTAPTQALHPEPAPPARSTVAENVRGRVEKIKQVSNIVIDQAAYDPSLRFLLVAAVLFLLFIVLVLLSKVLG